MFDGSRKEPLGKFPVKVLETSADVQNFIDNTLATLDLGLGNKPTSINVNIDNVTYNEDENSDDFFRRTYLTDNKVHFNKTIQGVLNMVFNGLKGISKGKEILLTRYAEYNSVCGVKQGRLVCDMWISGNIRKYSIVITYNEFSHL